MKRCMLVLALFAATFSTRPASAAGLIIVEDTSWWPGPNPPQPRPLPPLHPPWPERPIRPPRVYPFAPLEIASVNVHARVNDQIATTSVDQEFYNPNPSRLEGTFVFPVPKGAHLDKFTMEIDGKPVEAELLSADKGRRIYEDIVRKLRDPALLEYSDRDLFKVRIFPIEPHSKKRITISYTQLLKADSGLITYSLPLSTEKFSCRPIQNITVKIDLETKRPLKSIYSPTHTLEIKREGPNRATATFEAADARPDSDLALYFAPQKDEIGVNLLTYKPADADGYFILLASPGIDIQEKRLILKDVVFVLDTSGSMAGKKLEQAKKALEFCVENLNDGDRFEVMRFSTEVEPLFNQLVEANKNNRAKAEDFVHDLKAIGATAIDDALRKALELRTPSHKTDETGARGHNSRPFLIIFLTDGRPTIGTTDEEQIVANVKRENDGHTRIFCFGIGTDVNTHLLDKITEQTHAFSQYVLPEEDIEVKLSSFFSKIKEPVLSDPRLAFTGDIHATKLYPSPLPDLFKGEQLVLVGRYSGQGDSAVIIEGSVNGAPRKFTYEVKFSGRASENDFIPRLWATRRVGYLLDEIRLHGENSELKDEVTELARKYGIVTPYTAYLIAEDEKQREVPPPMRLMENLHRDLQVREEAAQSWYQFRTQREGDAGVASALSGQALKSADAAAPAAGLADSVFARRYGLRSQTSTPGQPGGDSVQLRLAQYARQAQFVAGKTFFQNDNQWIDSALQDSPKLKTIKLVFGSPEYFEFAARHPQATPWLSLGQNVRFLLDNTIYEIHE